MNKKNEKIAYYHLPGLFEFYELYKLFLPLFYKHREYFYEWCDIGSIYGAPLDCIWGGGREEEHLGDKRCNRLCSMFNENDKIRNGVIIHSDLLLNYLKKNYENLYFVSSTTKVLTEYNDFLDEVNRDDFLYVVPDFRLNKALDKLSILPDDKKKKVEFLCNECCYIGCFDRKNCYENVSRKSLLQNCSDHVCVSQDAKEGYRFSKAMKNPAFIGVGDIINTYIPLGFTNFKIEGRGLGSALVLEFILYYMTKPEYQINVREEIYLDSMLDLF